MIRGGVQVWLAMAPVDMRKSFDALAEVVRAFLGHDPLCGSLFVFRNRTRERVKILWYADGGLTIYYKRLDRGTFQFPADHAASGKSLTITSAQLMKLLSGCAVESRHERWAAGDAWRTDPPPAPL
ncbi:IS66 family insertion sequence element accessory protein TnpB [soil metagenome]